MSRGRGEFLGCREGKLSFAGSACKQQGISKNSSYDEVTVLFPSYVTPSQSEG